MTQMKVSIGLFNPKSPENVDAVLRAAGNYGADGIFYTGTRYLKALALNPDIPNIRRRVSENILLNQVDCLVSSVPINTRIVCVEFAENASALPAYEHPDNACYIFGPEDGSLPQTIIDKADAVVYVPTKGCMNLAATVNVLLYDRMQKLSQFDANQLGLAQLDSANTLIRESRDTNNNLKVRIK